MRLTVRAALKLSVLNDAEVIAGQGGLDNEVRRVSILDAPDISQWVSGGELVLTNAYLFRADPGLPLQLIKDFSAKGCAALGVKLGRFIEQLSPDVLDLAEELGFPILKIPFEAVWTDIMNAVLSEILNKQAKALRHAQEINHRFARRTLEGGGFKAIASTLSDLVGNPVAICDRYFGALTEPGVTEWGVGIEDIVSDSKSEGLGLGREAETDLEGTVGSGYEVLSSIRRVVRNNVGHVHTPVDVPQHRLGYILVREQNRTLGSVDVVAIEQALTVAALEFMKDRAVAEVERRFRANLIDDLILGYFESPESMVRRARSLGWNLSEPQIVLVADIDNFAAYCTRVIKSDPGKGESFLRDLRDRMFREVNDALTRAHANIISMDRSDSIVILSTVSDTRTKQALRERALELAGVVRAAVCERVRDLTVTVGVGRFYQEIRNLPRSYKEASHALHIGRAISGRNQVYHYDDLGVARLFFGRSGDTELAAFQEEMIGALEAYDAGRGSNLVRTLECYLEADGNLTEAAASLFMHVNTLKYRLKRIREISGIGLRSASDKTNLSIALKIRRLRQQRSPAS